MNNADTTVRIDAHITLPLDDGTGLPMKQTIHAFPTNIPGLVVFPLILSPLDTDPDWWNVTHAASGKRLPTTFRSRAAAEAFANAVGPLADWEQPQPHVVDKGAFKALTAKHGGLTDAEYRTAAQSERTSTN
ncbi:hypothetical protein [Streptomyces sp. AA1529]|uniref:hypothetical protein n=1 Tax=Streptomyces sp. AA1529 TaxID=1203257 RepID=UPI0002DDE225|nr:hypothetical protein [Streptomyces sp. AA1529]